MIADGDDVDGIASEVSSASDKAFSSIQNDPGFSEAVWVLTQLAIAAKSDDPRAHLETVGLRLAPQSSVGDVAAAIHTKLDASSSARLDRSDFGEMAQSALIGAVAEHLHERLGSLVEPSSGEVYSCLSQLGRMADFGRLTRTFFARLAADCSDYFLSKTIGAQVGAGQRFSSTAQMTEFQSALSTHASEAALIVEKYSAEWLSKHRFEGGGQITRQESDQFGWFALHKLRGEIRARTIDAT